MRSRLFLLFIISFIKINVSAQKTPDCSIHDGSIDTIEINQNKKILELSFCENTQIYVDGLVTDLKGQEEFCFFYKYSTKGKLKKIVFWEFSWTDSGYTTQKRIATLKIKKERTVLKNHTNYTLDISFVTNLVNGNYVK